MHIYMYIYIYIYICIYIYVYSIMSPTTDELLIIIVLSYNLLTGNLMTKKVLLYWR